MKEIRNYVKQSKMKMIMATALLSVMMLCSRASSHVDTGGNATTKDHSKQVIGYITNWDAWKTTTAGVPAQGALNHLNIDYNKYTILNYSFFGVAKDGSLHSGDHRNKNIWKDTEEQAPADLLFTDIYSSWDLHILYGELDPINYISAAAKQRCEDQGFTVQLNGTTWTNDTWGLSGSLPVPIHKEGGAKGLLELAHDKGVKVMASIGGWSMCKHFREMAGDTVKRQRFIDDCKKLINMGFDGIDLDWEYPGPFSGMNFTGTQADYANFLTLVQDIRTAIGSDKLITGAFSASTQKIEGFDWQALNQYMNYFNFMTYDFNGGWADKAGHNANQYDYTDSAESGINWEVLYTFLTNKSVPLSKVCFGVPFYGRGVECSGSAALNAPTVKRSEFVQPDGPITTAADFTNWPRDIYDGTPNWFFIKQKALGTNSAWTHHWDDEAKVPYLTNGKWFLSYDDETSLEHKAQYVVDNEIGGVIVWTVFGDLEISGTKTSYGAKLAQWSDVKSPLINTINDVFADGGDPSDTEAPSKPTALKQDGVGTNSISFSWNASTDNVGVAGYKLYLDDVYMRTQTVLNADITQLAENTSYSVSVSAVDAAGNESARSDALVIKTNGGGTQDTEAPSKPNGLKQDSVGKNEISFSWNASTDNVGVTGYKLYLDDVYNRTQTALNADITQLTENTSYSVSISAVDAAGNESARSDALVIKTDSGGTPDTEAPSKPTALKQDSVGNTVISFSWNASTDNVGVTGYKLYLDDVYTRTQTALNADITQLTKNTSYSVTVSAVDAAGNESARSDARVIKTLNGDTSDTEAPSKPAGLKQEGAGKNFITFSWNASTDNVGVTGYKLYLDDVYQRTQTELKADVTQLTADKSYSVRVSAVDAAGNESERSDAIVIRTDSADSPDPDNPDDPDTPDDGSGCFISSMN